jgi:HlyD family secretion protein
MKKLIIILVALWGGGALGVWYWNEARGQKVAYRTVAVRRGDLLATVNATGTLEPEEVVDVGAQVAGMIQSFGGDPRDPSKPISYGSPVDRGTVLARLDDALFKARVDQSRAGLAKAEADVEQAAAKLRQAKRELDRSRKIQDRGQGMISVKETDAALADYESAKAALDVAEGAAGVAKANLEEATVNLGYTTITSPVKGVILDRRVNIGQTVVASLNAPSLFLIAKDLSRMQIWASVNENDVGGIHKDQPVHFTVGAFPGETFGGRVAQIRLNASMTQNVVTYTVVVDVDNPGGKLLPYLTARLQFEVERRSGVLLVPGGALRWQPKLTQVIPGARAAFADELRRKAAERPDKGATRSGQPSRRGTLWVVAGEGFVRPVPVSVGLSDGVMVEVAGDGLKEGTEVVIGQSAEDEAEGSATPFLPQIKNDKVAKKK